MAALESRALAEQFDITQRYVIEHSCGHVVPSSRAVVNRIRDFLKRHVSEAGSAVVSAIDAGRKTGSAIAATAAL